MAVRIRFVVILLLIGLLFTTSTGIAATSGDDETDVIDVTSDTGITKAQPGENNVVIQAVEVADAGDQGDENEDGFDTAIETVIVRKVSGSTLEDRFIRKIKLYLDNDPAQGKFEPDKDFLLGEVSNPNLTAGVVFGAPGSLLTNVEDNDKVIFFVVADFADDAPDGATLRTSFDLTVSDSLLGGPTISSGLDPAAFPPVLRGSGVKGDPKYFFLKITSTTGDDETDIIDETPAITATPGDLVVLQQFTIADPGPTGDADKDGKPTLVRNITVKKVSGTADITKISKLMLYREKANTPPGFQEDDELLGIIVNPNLDDGVVFHNNGRRLLRVADGSEERLYVVAKLAPVGFEDGDTLQTEISVVAKDDPEEPGAEDSSGIETPMPVIASNPLIIEVPPPTIIISDAEIKTGEQSIITISVRYIPEPGLGEFQLGPQGALVYDPDVLEVLGIRGVSPYRLETYDMSIPGLIYFILALKPGRKAINEGPVLQLVVRPVEGVEPGTQTTLEIKDDLGLETVDAFKDVNGKDLVPDIVPGKVTIRLLAGDVDGDAVVTISDARLVARYILGLERLTPEQLRAADVAPPKGMIDVTDVRYIAQAAAGLRELDPAASALGSISTGGLHGSRSIIDILLSLFGFHLGSQPRSQSRITMEATETTITISAQGAVPIDIQGTLSFDPTRMRVLSVSGVNGYTVLAAQIDNEVGKVRFVASQLSGSPKGGPILEFEIQGHDVMPRLSFDLLRDEAGRDLEASMDYGNGIAAPLPLLLSQVQTYVSKQMIKFEALGEGIESIEVRIFDLAGSEIFSSTAAGTALEWDLLDNRARTVANGVYLYRVTVKGVDGHIQSRIGKLIVLR